MVSYADLAWLARCFQYPFHPSDPLNYYVDVKGREFREILQFESTNTIYFLVNWLLDRIYPNSPVFIAFLIKTVNALVFITTYLLATRKREDICIIDFLLLFNPYTLMTINRNVRDLYIILFVLMIIIGIGCIKNDRLSPVWTLMAVLLLGLYRPILLVPLFIVFLYEKRKNMLPWQWVAVAVICSLLIVLNIEAIFTRVTRQVISAMEYIGEDVSEFLPLLQGNISFGVCRMLMSRFAVGFVSFLFTPHPINHIVSWMNGMDALGNYGIYTGFDNVLVSLGSLYNYLLVIPLLFVMLRKEYLRKINWPILLFTCMFIVLYVVSYLGVTDIRNRSTAYFFMLLTLMHSDIPPKFTLRGYIYTFLVFCVIYVFSS